MHLTNYSLNKKSETYNYTEETHEMNLGSKRTLCSLWKSVQKENYSIQTIKKNIEELIIKFVLGIYPFMNFNVKTAFEGKMNNNIFQVIGVDILIDENLRAWFIEANANPSLHIEHEITSKDLKQKNSFICPVDSYVKEKVVGDAIKIGFFL